MTVLEFVNMYGAESDTAGINIFSSGYMEEFVYSDFKDEAILDQFKILFNRKVDMFLIGCTGTLNIITVR